MDRSLTENGGNVMPPGLLVVGGGRTWEFRGLVIHSDHSCPCKREHSPRLIVSCTHTYLQAFTLINTHTHIHPCPHWYSHLSRTNLYKHPRCHSTYQRPMSTEETPPRGSECVRIGGRPVPPDEGFPE